MARITLDKLRHSYMANPQTEADFALKRLSLEFEDGGAYALLGPSGCGKTTLLSLISGLLTPTEGKILFDGTDVTNAKPDHRNIAQVFQFPVIYDTMTVHDNLAFPLRNRGLPADLVETRVQEIAAMLDLTATLSNRASGLTADGKQKISLGRGLVRSDVNVIMLDEPLTVIDPHLKWKLRSKLKELYLRTRRTMIYVTHDQTEALTFADQVVVMNNGEVVQIGTPIDLFERPRHTFVGHFIGSPGMNLLPCSVADGRVLVAGEVVQAANASAYRGNAQRLELGVRPEFIAFAERGFPAEVVRVSDAGRFRIVETQGAGQSIKLLVPDGIDIPAGRSFLRFDPDHTQVYADGWMVGAEP